MEQYHAEMLAVSRAGHDKGTYYVVLGQEGGVLFLTDGKNRLLEQPKRKNQKHVQLIKHLPGEMMAELSHIGSDADVRRALKLYQSLSAPNSKEKR